MNKPVSSYSLTSPLLYFVAFSVGLLFGSFKFLNILEGIGFLYISAIILFFAFQNNIEKVFTYLPYIIYSEIIVKGNAKFLPYIFSAYLLIVVFLILITRRSGKVQIHSKGFVLLLFFVIIEIADSVRAKNADSARFLVIYSLSLFMVVSWASFTQLTPKVINVFFKNLKIASIFLCGVILVAHFKGNINYSLESSFASTNGLEPVQISAYLGFSSAVFFLSVMSDMERSNIFLNTILLSVNTVVMLLSFSRGGLYFLAIFILLYFIFNLGKAKNYFLLFLLIPVAIGIYYYVTISTGGVIEERYAQNGTAGRDELIKAGIALFKSNPIAGVGTGNFGYAIEKEGLFRGESGAHNEFIRAAAEHGILGIIIYWGFLFCFFLK